MSEPTGTGEHTDGDSRGAQDRRLQGWGGAEDPPALSQEQAARLQEREEPVASGDFGGQLRGDLGNAEVADESADAPETVDPDTSLGHEGGRRYGEFSGGAGGQA